MKKINVSTCGVEKLSMQEMACINGGNLALNMMGSGMISPVIWGETALHFIKGVYEGVRDRLQ